MVNSLKLIRINRGLTQQEISDKLNVSRTLVSKWESGSARPAAEQIRELAVIFGLTEEDVLNAVDSVDIDPVTLKNYSSEIEDRLNELHLILSREISDVIDEQNRKMEEFNTTYELERMRYERRLNKIVACMIIVVVIAAVLVYGYAFLSSKHKRDQSYDQNAESSPVIEITVYTGPQS